MGNARARGNYEQRRAAAIEAGRVKEPSRASAPHVFGEIDAVTFGRGLAKGQMANVEASAFMLALASAMRLRRRR